MPELVRISRGVVNLYERRRVRVFLRRDPYRRFFSCLIYVPRDRYNTQARERIERILRDELSGTALESQVQISESALARLHTLVRTTPDREVNAGRRPHRAADHRDTAHLERPAARRAAGKAAAGCRQRRLPRATPRRFRSPTRRTSAPRDAIVDIEELRSAARAAARRSACSCGAGDAARAHCACGLYRRGEPLAMSDLLPLLENFDLRMQNERPYRIASDDGAGCGSRISRSPMPAARRSIRQRSAQRFEEAFFAVWNGRAESDGFNRLVLAAGLDWRQAMVLRAVCRYVLQTGLPFSQRYMEDRARRTTPTWPQRLSRLFESRFDPAIAPAARDVAGPYAQPRD